MTIWLRGFFGDRVEFFIIIDSYIHDMLYVLLVEWQYTYALEGMEVTVFGIIITDW
jgi:hypothetical protein